MYLSEFRKLREIDTYNIILQENQVPQESEAYQDQQANKDQTVFKDQWVSMLGLY